MKYTPGDDIIVLQTDEAGKVLEILNEKMVMIEVRGVKFPAYTDQIDFPYFKMFSKKKAAPEKKVVYVDAVKREKKVIKQKTGDGVYLSFFPVYDKDIWEDDVVEKLKVYFINQNEEAYNFDYNLLFEGKPGFGLKNTLEGLSEFYLHDVSFDDMGEGPKFEFEFSLNKPDKRKAPAHEVFFKLRGKQLFKKIEDTRAKNEASFVYELFTHYPDKPADTGLDLRKLNNAGFRLNATGEYKEHLPPARSVVDLHVEKLSDQPDKLSSSEILDLQMRTYEQYLDLALAHRQKHIIFIHGIGEGTLRDEIHGRLKLRKEVKSFVNQFHPLYGWGATEVFFK